MSHPHTEKYGSAEIWKEVNAQYGPKTDGSLAAPHCSPALYGERDSMALGEYYVRHVSAMTSEGLHSKAAIAAELAYRDKQIDELREQMTKAVAKLETVKAMIRPTICTCDGEFSEKHHQPCCPYEIMRDLFHSENADSSDLRDKPKT